MRGRKGGGGGRGVPEGGWERRAEVKGEAAKKGMGGCGGRDLGRQTKFATCPRSVPKAPNQKVSTSLGCMVSNCRPYPSHGAIQTN
jgi:hypothetical protein